MQTTIIGGFLGTGKTSLILKLVDNLVDEFKLAIIENESGEIGIDGKVIREKDIEVSEITSGCICCQVSGQLRDAYEFLQNEYNPSLVIIEPTGIAFPSQIDDIVTSYSNLGAVFILVDLPRIPELTEQIRPSQKQLEEANHILLNKIDLGEEKEVREKCKELTEKYPDKDIYKLSCKTGKGVNKVLDEIKKSCQA